MTRTSAILGVVALAMLAFIVFFERGTVSTGEREQRKGRIFDKLVRDRVTHIEIQRKGVTTIIARHEDKEHDLPLGLWQVEAPYKASADQETVTTLLGSLEWVEPKREIHDITAKDLTQFGLDKPRYRVRFDVGGEEVRFSVGHPSPQIRGVYLQLTDPSVVYVVTDDIIEALDREPELYHTKDLHEGVSAFSLIKLALTGQEGERALERRGENWWLVKPETVLASEPTVIGIANAFDTLKGTRFVSNDVPADAGLDKPKFEITSVTHEFDPKHKGQTIDTTLTLRVGAACADHAGESYVRADKGPLMCAADSELAKLEQPAAGLVERRLLTLEDSQIHGVVLRDGATELRLSEAGKTYTLKLTVNGRVKREGAVDSAALAAWLGNLRATVAQSVTPSASPSLDAGLGADARVLTFERIKDKPAYALRVGRPDAGRMPVGRKEDSRVLWFSDSVAPALDAAALAVQLAPAAQQH